MNSAQVRWFMVPIVALFMAISLWAVEKEVSTTATAGPANGGFEWFDNAATPTGWAVTSGALLPGGMVAVATDVNHSGKTSLVIHNTTQTTVTLSSEPMQLKVGHLYRLSGWIKTQGAITDPVARYPTPVPACLSMSSFPFEESSSAVGGTSDWRDVSALFFATRSADCVHVHLGRNGNCIGTAWFDDLRVDEVEDIREYIPLETVRWSGPGYRYDDHGWIFVHIEGDPYPRGRQYGELVAGEIVRYMKKLAIRQNEKDPNQGWNDIRLMTDAIFLRKFDAEYLEEMRGIADGAAKAGAMFNDRPLDLLDIVAINSAIDIGQLSSAVGVTATPLTGRNFFRADDEMAIPDDKNKCSSFVATHSATTNGRFVFAQMFMWNGYTGVNWEIFVDVVPTKGHRLLYETFPAGIHSGSDFYVNDAGIVIGETTTAQTPFNPDGTPQSNRIRKAAQYAASIDDVVGILTDKNNGLYTNDWTIADAKSDEVADLMLGTKKWKVWRTGTDTIPADTPGGLKDYIWANNNCRDPEVRKEFIPHPENAPFDLIFNPWNRDIQFVEFYRRYGEGKIDSTAAINLCATSPMNRPHACDAKVETAEMAEQLMVMAHYGKTTLREKMIGGRFIADLPGATPHLSLGYTTFSPIFVTEKLKALHQNSAADKKSDTKGTAPAKNVDLKGVEEFFSYPKSLLWANTVFPASDAEGWFVSGTAAYWRILRDLPDKPEKALDYMMEKLPELNSRFLYMTSREDDTAPLAAKKVYDRYGQYLLPRIKGTILLHQLRLLLGNSTFGKIMDAVHSRYAGQSMTTENFIRMANEISTLDLRSFIMQWLERTGLPDVEFTATQSKTGKDFAVTLAARQHGLPYHLVFCVQIETAKSVCYRKVEITSATEKVIIHVPDAPVKLVFNPVADFPAPAANYYTLANFADDFNNSLIIYGTVRQIEAGRTLAQNWSTTLGDAFSEYLTPVRKDCEVTEEELAGKDLFVLGGLADNEVIRKLMAEKRLPVEISKNMFRWKDKTYARQEDGLILVIPNPYNPKRTLYLFLSNSAIELYRMTKQYQRGLPSWEVFSGDDVVAKGFLLSGGRYEVKFPVAMNVEK